jgi:hypothetical protein
MEPSTSRAMAAGNRIKQHRKTAVSEPRQEADGAQHQQGDGCRQQNQAAPQNPPTESSSTAKMPWQHQAARQCMPC